VRACVHRVSARTCMSICVCTVFLKKKSMNSFPVQDKQVQSKLFFFLKEMLVRTFNKKT
jgi:hypothetical protein